VAKKPTLHVDDVANMPFMYKKENVPHVGLVSRVKSGTTIGLKTNKILQTLIFIHDLPLYGIKWIKEKEAGYVTPSYYCG